MPTYVLSHNPTTITSTVSVTGIAVYGGAGTAWDVINLSSIQGTGSSGIGILLETGGTITNGAASDTTSLISGSGLAAIEVLGAPGTVSNYGTITDAGGNSNYGFAIYLRHGGNITNGSASDTAALISGDGGLQMGVGGKFYTTIMVTNAAGTVTNFGTIKPTSNSLGEDVIFEAGGTVVNGPSGATGALITGLIGVAISGGAGTVTNFGTIHTTSILFEGGTGVELGNGGSVTNGAATDTSAFIGGYIQTINPKAGIEHGIYIGGGAGTVTNFGTVTGVVLGHGGQVINGPSGASGALIDSYYAAVAIGGAVGSVTNFGTIEAYTDGFGAIGVGVYLNYLGSSLVNGASTAKTALIKGSGNNSVGVELNAAGTVTNFGTIQGVTGIVLTASGTVVDAGTIGGSGGTAVSFGGTDGNLLALENGYKLTGAVQGSGSATNTLELVGTLGDSVTASYNGLQLSNFQDVLFGAGGFETLKVSNTTGTLGAMLSGFTLTSDVVDLTGLAGGTISGGGTLNAFDQLVISNGSETVTLQLDNTEDYTGLVWQPTTDGGSGTDVSAACFMRGTRILTESGELAVEELAVGDKVATLTGGAQRVRWLGRRAYDGRFIADNLQVLPICIMAGALSDGVPARNLWVSPEHSLFIDGALAQAKHLVNGATIVQEKSVASLEYFHVELDEHAILIAEGAPAESYVDCDNRLMFSNGAEYARLFQNDERPRWAFCAPRLDWGSQQLTTIRAALLERAAAQGHPLTTDPDLHLVVDGAIVRPETMIGEVYRFQLPAGSTAVSLCSRGTVPAEVEIASSDIRRLGVPVARIVLCDADFSLEAWHSHAALCDGFHQDEATHRWTNGLAHLPDWWLRPFTGAFTLEICLIPSDLGYRLPPAARALAA